mmetsp:Transcript_63205/g.203734  ORF Transcript_63205/g.203734 Transcript_63205/m.203734 type:complete len:333 (-) Transcript_63205:585-1583(-)
MCCDTTLRRSSSFTNRRPCWSSRIPPLPRRASGPRYFVWFPGSRGSMKAVGWSCTFSMSMRFAPMAWPKRMASPFAKDPFVVGTPRRSGRNFAIRLPSDLSYPNPPVVRTTASQSSVCCTPASSTYATPWTSLRSGCSIRPVTVQPCFTSIVGMLSTAARACCMMVKPTGTGVPSLRGGTRCVRFLAWPPSCVSTERSTPTSSMSQWMASALFPASIETQPMSLLPPTALTCVSRSKYLPSSSTPFLYCTRVPHALMPLVAFAELPPQAGSFSRSVTWARACDAWIAALTPARPPPTTTTCAGKCRLNRSSRCSGSSAVGARIRTSRGPSRA